jgi:iron complex transport system permease protein
MCSVVGKKMRRIRREPYPEDEMKIDERVLPAESIGKHELSESGKLSYRRLILIKTTVIICLLVLLLSCFLIDISTGSAKLSLSDVVKSILNFDSVDKKTLIIVRVIRLPIATMAVIVGACLALAGMEMQTILNNSLASPYTLGISSAASFGAALSLVIGHSVLPEILQNIATPVFAFVFSLGSSMIIYTIAKFKKNKSTMILSGIAINFLFSALISILVYFVKDEVLRGIASWTQGNILGATWQKIIVVLVTSSIVIPFLIKDSWKLTALCMGDNTAQALGVRVEKLRTKVLVLTSIITAVAVAFVGTIGFVGLVAPYLAKTLVGEEQRFFIPVSLLTGGLMLSIASILSKTLIPDGQIPIGIITSVIGIPFLLLLILKNEKA